MPWTPAMSDALKSSLGDAYNNWRAGNTSKGDPSCRWGSGPCNEADAITTKTDYTSKNKRKEIVQMCIESLISSPNCLGKYQSANVLKPYLAELVDQGKIKDEGGVIKKFYRREDDIDEDSEANEDDGNDDGPDTRLERRRFLVPGDFFSGVPRIGIPLASGPKPLMIAEESKSSLASTWNKTQENIAKGDPQPCPSAPNACDTAKIATTKDDNLKKKIETCIGFLADSPDCLENYKHDISTAPYLNQLIDEKKIKSVDGKIAQLLPFESTKPNQKRNADPGNLNYGLPGNSWQGFQGFHVPVKTGPEPIADQLKDSLASAWNKTQQNVANGATLSCPPVPNACDDAKQGGRGKIEACLGFLNDCPDCSERYKHDIAVAPYLNQLIDEKKIKSVGGKIHEDKPAPPIPHSPPSVHVRAPQNEKPLTVDKLVIGQGFSDVLAGAFNKWKEDTAKHLELSCPSKKKNACDNPYVVLAGGPLALEQKERQHTLEMCIAFLGRHPHCFQRYETNGFITPHLENLAADGKIKGYHTNRPKREARFRGGSSRGGGSRFGGLFGGRGGSSGGSSSPPKDNTPPKDTVPANAPPKDPPATPDAPSNPLLPQIGVNIDPLDASAAPAVPSDDDATSGAAPANSTDGSATLGEDAVAPTDVAAAGSASVTTESTTTDSPVAGNVKRLIPVIVASHPVKPGPPKSPTPIISETLKDKLKEAWDKWDAKLMAHADISCPPRENDCDRAAFWFGEGVLVFDKDRQSFERQGWAAKCVRTLSEEPDCVGNYKDKVYVRPYIDQLIDNGKIKLPRSKSGAKGSKGASGGGAKRPAQSPAKAPVAPVQSSAKAPAQSQAKLPTQPTSAAAQSAAPKPSNNGEKPQAGGQKPNSAAPAISAPAIQKSKSAARPSSAAVTSAAIVSAQKPTPVVQSAQSPASVPSSVASLSQKPTSSAQSALTSDLKSAPAQVTSSVAKDTDQPASSSDQPKPATPDAASKPSASDAQPNSSASNDQPKPSAPDAQRSSVSNDQSDAPPVASKAPENEVKPSTGGQQPPAGEHKPVSSTNPSGQSNESTGNAGPTVPGNIQNGRGQNGQGQYGQSFNGGNSIP